MFYSSHARPLPDCTMTSPLQDFVKVTWSAPCINTMTSASKLEPLLRILRCPGSWPRRGSDYILERSPTSHLICTSESRPAHTILVGTLFLRPLPTTAGVLSQSPGCWFTGHAPLAFGSTEKRPGIRRNVRRIPISSALAGGYLAYSAARIQSAPTRWATEVRRRAERVFHSMPSSSVLWGVSFYTGAYRYLYGTSPHVVSRWGELSVSQQRWHRRTEIQLIAIQVGCGYTAVSPVTIYSPK